MGSEPRGFGRMKPKSGNHSRAPMPHELVDMLEWPKNGDSVSIRPVGDVVGYVVHKIKVRKKDGSETEITKPCLAYDPETDTIDSTKECPYCNLPTGKEDGMASSRHLYFVNAIVRNLQETRPRKLQPPTASERKTGLKDMSSSTWTPVRVLRTPSTLAERFQKLGSRNLVVNPKTKEKKAFDVNHPRFGFDLDVSFDKNASPANMYSADRCEAPDGGKYSPLSDEEKEYLLYDLSNLYVPEDLATAQKEADSLEERWFGESGGGKKKTKPSAKGRGRQDDYEDDDDADDGDDFDDEDDFDIDSKAQKGKKSTAPSKKRHQDDEDDFDDSDFDDDEDEDDEPPRSARGKKAQAKKPNKRHLEDEDDDEDDDFDEDDSDDLDSFDADDDDSRRGKATKGRTAESKGRAGKKPSRRSADEDDFDDEEADDDDDFGDFDDDEDEEPKAKRSAKAVKGKSSKKRSRDEDDFDDEEDDFDDDIPF